MMTNAFIDRNVTYTNNTPPVDKSKEETLDKIVIESNCTPDGISLILNCTCNSSVSNLNEKNNNNPNSSDVNTGVNTCVPQTKNNQSIANDPANLDTVLKYVFKNNQKSDMLNKTYGHPKNSVRRKRSTNIEKLNDTKLPLIVDYETSHTPQRDVETWVPNKNTANIIKKADLADFNIETLHENTGDNKQLQNQHFNNQTPKLPEHTDDSYESVERDNGDQANNLMSNNDSKESDERESIENSSEDVQKKISDKYYDTPKNNKDENTSNEEITYSSTEAHKKENEGSNDSRDSTPKYSKFHNTEDESIENSSEELKKDDFRQYSEKSKEEDSDEDTNSKYISETNRQKLNVTNDSLPVKIQDVDLGEYERIQVNKHGEVEPTIDNYETRDFDTAVEEISTSKPYTGSKQNDKLSSLSDENVNFSSVESNEHNEPTHINDGEVKPVVEINAEVDSSESSIENSNEALKAKLENESLETLTGVNEKDGYAKSKQLQNEKQSPIQGDVKQQFERIPLNYNHAKQNTKINEDEDESKIDNHDNTENDGTLDQVKPRYDENLGIKFDDIHIKLPEIKLPDDILSYPFENPPVYKVLSEKHNEPRLYNNRNHRTKEEQVEKPTFYSDAPVYEQKSKKNDHEKTKPKFFHYSDEIHDEPLEKSSHDNQSDDEDDDEEDEYSNNNNDKHYGYFGDKKKEDYKQKKREEGDDDDLYEKFVRERFGKRGTFEKRLEKLTDHKAQNPHLYKKVQNILKKTKDVREQADKSGDPKAGYMWTLEYGEKL